MGSLSDCRGLGTVTVPSGVVGQSPTVLLLLLQFFAPQGHHVLRLANRAGLDLLDGWLLLLGRMNAFCLMGRYPGNPTTQSIPTDIAHRYLREAQEVRTWLQQKLSTP